MASCTDRIMWRPTRPTGGRMRTDRAADGALAPELEAIATAAHDRLKAQAGEDLSAIDQAGRASPRPPVPPAPASPRSRIRTGHRPRWRTRTLPTARSPTPPRSRTAPSARSSPAPSRPRTTDTQPSSNRLTARRARSPHRHGQSATRRRHPGARARARLGQRPAQLLFTQPLALRQPLGQVIAIRPGAGEIGPCSRARPPP